jgi:hypothetical protein
VELKYLTSSAEVFTKTYDLAPNSRTTIWVDQEIIPGLGQVLANASVSTTVTSVNGVPIIAERAMWWPSPNWHEAHNSAGSVVTSPRWAVAEGEVGGTRNLDTYVLIANTSATLANVNVTVFYEGGGIPSTKLYEVAANSRFNVDFRNMFELSVGTRFSALVEAVGGQELVVERAMYSTSRGVVWAAGTNALGTPLFPDATFIITPGGIFPKKIVVAEGTRVKFINRDTKGRQMSSDPHPNHDDCPPINDNGFVNPGQEALTANMILDPGLHACGVHDHIDDQNDAVRAKIIVR